MKALSAFFSVSIDDLLSGDALLTIAEEYSRQTADSFRNLVFGILDSSIVIFFLPFLDQTADDVITSVSLLGLTGVSPWLRITYFAVVIGIAVWGLLTLGLQSCQNTVWKNCRCRISMIINAIAVLLFIAGLQPYAAAYLFILMAIKTVILIKKQ